MKKIYYFLMAAFVAIALSACDKDAEVYDLLPDDETENPDNGNNNGNNSDGENNSEAVWEWFTAMSLPLKTILRTLPPMMFRIIRASLIL